MADTQYVVHWAYIDPKAAGGGSCEGRGSPLPRQAAIDFCSACNQLHPHIHHWVMPVSLSAAVATHD